MKRNLIFFIVFITFLKAKSQVIYNEPLFDKSIKSFTKISKIEVDNEKTLVYYDVINSNPISEDDSYYTREIRTIHFYMQGEKGQEAFALQDAESKKVYKQIKSKASNMPRGVDKKNYDLIGQQRKSFVMAFEKLDSNTKVINLFHGSDYNWGRTSGDYWFIYGIKLMSDNEKINYLAEKNITEKNRQEAYAASQERYKKEQAEYERKEIERKALIKSQIESRTFTGVHFYDYGDFIYTGSFINGVPNGQGKWEKPDGSWYEGKFQDGVENGIGTLRQTSGLRYTGNFTNGYPNGAFKIERWTLMGLAKDTWTAEYKDGNLVSSSQTETGMTDFLNSKPTTSSISSNNQKSSSSSTIKIVATKNKKEYCGYSVSSYKFFTYLNDNLLSPPKLTESYSVISLDKNGVWWTGCVDEIGSEKIGKFLNFESAVKAYYKLRYEEANGIGTFVIQYD